MAEITEWVKKIWKNRITEFPTRRELTKEDGSSEIVTVTRNEGTVSEEGDAFDADTMNNLEERIDAGFADVTRKLTASDNTPFRFGVTASGEYGYVVTDSAGADTVIPFKKYGIPTVLYSYGVSNSGAGSVSTTKTMPRDGLCIVFAHTCGSNYFLNPTVKLNNVAQKILTSYKADDNTKGGNAACFEVKKGDSVYALAPKDSGSSGQAGIIMLII